MASRGAIKSSIKTLGIYQKPGLFDKGLGALLPEAYKKFYKEWKMTEPTAVHYIPEPGKWKRDEVSGTVSPVQNIPLPLLFPKEHNDQIWGGEAIVQGFEPRNKQRRVPHFWVPVLKRSVVRSEVLDKYFAVIVTNRAINLINAHYGFDHYLLKTPACDLKSLLTLQLKRKVLKELEAGCPTYSDRPDIQKQILEKYQKYLEAYTPEEIEWYGYTFTEACTRLEKQMEQQTKSNVVPLKHVYRMQLIDQLKNEKDSPTTEGQLEDTQSSVSWLGKINPFGRKQET